MQLSNSCLLCLQVITDNLASDQFLPPRHRSAINAAKQWMAEEWPHHFRLKPLPRDRFLAPHVYLSGSNNNTSNPVHKREKHGACSADMHADQWQDVTCCAVLCCAVLCCAVLCRAVLCRAVPCRAVPCRAVLCCAVLCLPVRLKPGAVLPLPLNSFACIS